jgi:hypothetical protein
MMANSEQPGSGGRDDWPIRLAGAVGGALGGTLALLAGPLADLHLPLPWGAIAFVAAVGVGIVLGRLAGSLLFRRPPAR